ncbi:MAG: hypothetical protein ACI4MP_01220 [Candidatus Ventricola sp.]
MAQRRRKEQQMKKQQRIITALCIAGGIGAVLLSLVVCILIFDPFADSAPVSAPVATALPYSASEPFSLSDLTAEQISQIRKSGRMTVSDGPRGVSVGDTLEKLIERLPTDVGKTAQTSQQTVMQSDEEMALYCAEYLEKQNTGAQTGLQSDEEMILYCAEYFENQNGMMTALPPRGLINVNNGQIVVTLLAPTSSYPADTRDSYGAYEHVYCLYTIDPESMTISSIVLGIDQ